MLNSDLSKKTAGQLFLGILVLEAVLWTPNYHHLKDLLFGLALLTVSRIIISQGFSRSELGITKPVSSQFWPIVIFGVLLGAAIVLAGWVHGSLHIQPHYDRLAKYIVIAWLQEFTAMALVLLALQKIISSSKLQILVTGLICGALHLPNLLLTGLSTLLFIFTAAVFIKTRNIWALWILHCILGISLALAFKINMNVGINYWILPGPK